MKKMYVTLIFLCMLLTSCMYRRVVNSDNIKSITVGLRSPYNVLLEKMTDRECMSSIADIINKDAENSVKAEDGDYDMMMTIDLGRGEKVIKRISDNIFVMQNGSAFKSETLGKYFSELKSGGIQKLKTNPPVVKFDVVNYTKSDVDNIGANPPEEMTEFMKIYKISDAIPEVSKEYVEVAAREARGAGLDTGKAFETISREMKEPYLPVYCIYSEFNSEKAWIINVIYSDYTPSDSSAKDTFGSNANLKKIRSFVVTPEGKLLYSN